MVIGWIGKMGSGKTLNMSKWALVIADLTGKPIYANYHLHTARYFTNFKDLNSVRDAIVVYDEISVDHDSRNWENNQKFTHWFLQVRKTGNDFFYTTQNIDSLEKRVRRNTDYMFWCKKNRKTGHLSEAIFDCQTSLDNATYCKTLRLTKPELIYQYYNTREVIRENLMQ